MKELEATEELKERRPQIDKVEATLRGQSMLTITMPLKLMVLVSLHSHSRGGSVVMCGVLVLQYRKE